MKNLTNVIMLLVFIPVHSQFSLGSYQPFFSHEFPGWYNPALATKDGIPTLMGFSGTSIIGFPGRPVFYGLQGSGYIDYGIGFSAKFYQQKAGLSKTTGAMLSFLYHVPLAEKINLVFALSGLGEEYNFQYQDAIANNMHDPILTQELQEIPSFNSSFGIGLVSQNSFYVGIHTSRLIASKNQSLNNHITEPVQMLLTVQGGFQFNTGESHIWGLNALYEKEFDKNHYAYEGNISYTWNGSLGLTAGYASSKALKTSINLRIFGLGFGYQLAFSFWNDMVNNNSAFSLFSHGVYVKKLFNEQKPVR